MSHPGKDEDRIRKALGVPHGALPKVEDKWLAKYYRHLSVELEMPFTARTTGRDGFASADDISVVALVDPSATPAATEQGLFCVVDDVERRIEVPLQDIVVDADHPNHQLIEDYWYWFWNWSFDPRI